MRRVSAEHEQLVGRRRVSLCVWVGGVCANYVTGKGIHRTNELKGIAAHLLPPRRGSVAPASWRARVAGGRDLAPLGIFRVSHVEFVPERG